MLRKESWKSFIQRTETCEYIICIGAGKRLHNICNLFSDSHWLKKIKYIADNDLCKQGSEYSVLEQKITICAVGDLIPIVNGNTIVLITNTFHDSILKQLSAYKEFEHVDIYVSSYLLAEHCDEMAMQKTIPADCKLSDKPLIPKTIHYCWFGKNPIPAHYKKWMESWKKYCPDYEIVEWNEDNYDISKNNYMLQAYENKKWGFVPDYARLDIIYNHGGIYLDTDVELVRNMDELLYQKGFAGFESNEYVALGLGFGAAPGNRMIKGMLDSYENYSFVDKSGKLNMTASPVMQTSYLLEHGLIQNGEYQILENEFTIYPEKMFAGKSLYSRRIKLTPYTCAIHHYDGSWVDEDKKRRAKQFEEEMNRID